MAATKSYVVQPGSGPRICDKRVKAGQVIKLTDLQAHYELLRGTVLPEGYKPPKPAAEKPKRSAESASAEAKPTEEPAVAGHSAPPAGDPPAPARKHHKLRRKNSGADTPAGAAE